MSAPLLSAGPRVRGRCRPSLLLCAVASTLPAALPAQNAFVVVGRGVSGSAAFPNVGLQGAAVTFAVNESWGVQVGVDTRTSSLMRTGETCINPQVDFQCVTEGISTENHFLSVSASALYSWTPVDRISLSVGPGILVGTGTSDNQPVSNRFAKVFVRKSAQFGVLGLGEVIFKPVASLPLVAVGQWQARRVFLEGCGGDAATYTPFCGSDWWSEFRAGVGVVF